MHLRSQPNRGVWRDASDASPEGSAARVEAVPHEEDPSTRKKTGAGQQVAIAEPVVPAACLPQGRQPPNVGPRSSSPASWRSRRSCRAPSSFLVLAMLAGR